MDERVAQYLHLDSCSFQTTVHRPYLGIGVFFEVFVHFFQDFLERLLFLVDDRQEFFLHGAAHRLFVGDAHLAP